ncbi:MAG: oligoendopeptidase F [Parachlamydiaceae bacterium]|nr:oligoendopeptidase F [Parachlamydiaceae bacterium]
MAVDRCTVDKEDQWNVEALFANMDSWDKAFAKASPSMEKPRWPILNNFKGKLGANAQSLKDALDVQFSLSREISTLYTYAHLRHDEDIANDLHKTAYNKILALYHDFAEESSWLEPELLALDETTINEFLKDPLLADYCFHLEKIIRIKKHMLSPQGEELLAMAAKAIQTPSKAFSAINDADFKFGTIQDSSGKEKELTHGLYGLYLRDKDRKLRENAFKKLQGKYLSYENTLCELLNGQIQAHVFNAKARNYSSCLEAALHPKNIDTQVYYALIKAVNDNIGHLHSYVQLREKIMGVGQLHLYDMYVPLMSAVDIRLSYKEAEEIVIESVAPLGAEYQDLLKKGFKEQRWVDRYENSNKRSGAYSSGCYDSMPYILMNYKGILRDVFTLAHEAGHSMHSLMSHKHQPYQYGDYPIFLAEVASTFNEDLLMRLMLERAKGKEERIFLINEKIEDIRGTLFRQTMFAEFELLIHEFAEKNIPLTPKLLKDEYDKLNRRYFGNIVIDDEAAIEWARIPHFYYNFYVFQYATGISAALALSERVSNGGEKERDEYLSFLKAGCSRYPIDILQSAGVNMRSPEPVAAAIAKFGALVTQLNNELLS